jgi:hypothetical protein
MTDTLLAMLALAVAWVDRGESPEARRELFRPVAEAIDAEAKTPRQKAFLIAQGFEDTKFARYVIEDRCLDGPKGQRCDEGRSHGPFGVSVKYCPSKDFRVQAHCALKAAWGGAQRCKDHSLSPPHAWFVGTAGMGRSCAWPGADRRVATFQRILARLEAP